MLLPLHPQQAHSCRGRPVVGSHNLGAWGVGEGAGTSAPSAGPNQGHRLLGFHFQSEAVEHLLVWARRVGEIDVLEPNGAFQGLWGEPLLRERVDLRLAFDNLKHGMGGSLACGHGGNARLHPRRAKARQWSMACGLRHGHHAGRTAAWPMAMAPIMTAKNVVMTSPVVRESSRIFW